jgi:predicted nucleic acid-binding Zn ribbon protein
MQEREKQIEEMKYDICTAADYCYGACEECNLGRLAEHLYNAGYRKQSEGEWKYDEDCECYVCSVCGHSALNNYRLLSTPSNFCPNCGAKMKGA